MARRVSRQYTSGHLLGLCALVIAFTACQQTTNMHRSSANATVKPILVAHAIGDSLTFPVGILTLDRTREIADVFVRQPE